MQQKNTIPQNTNKVRSTTTILTLEHSTYVRWTNSAFGKTTTITHSLVILSSVASVQRAGVSNRCTALFLNEGVAPLHFCGVEASRLFGLTRVVCSPLTKMPTLKVKRTRLC